MTGKPIRTAPPNTPVLVGVRVKKRWSFWVADSSEWGCDGERGDPPTHWWPLPE